MDMAPAFERKEGIQTQVTANPTDSIKAKAKSRIITGIRVHLDFIERDRPSLGMSTDATPTINVNIRNT